VGQGAGSKKKMFQVAGYGLQNHDRRPMTADRPRLIRIASCALPVADLPGTGNLELGT